MKIQEIIDSEGRLLSFEVGTTFVARHDVGNAFKSVPGIKVIKPASLFGDVFCECELNGKRFIAHMSWPDGEFYSIRPEPYEWNLDIELVRSAFSELRPLWGPINAFAIIALILSYFTAGLFDLFKSDPQVF